MILWMYVPLIGVLLSGNNAFKQLEKNKNFKIRSLF